MLKDLSLAQNAMEQTNSYATWSTCNANHEELVKEVGRERTFRMFYLFQQKVETNLLILKKCA